MTNFDDLFVSEIQRSVKEMNHEYDLEGDLLEDAIKWCRQQGYLPIRINDSMHLGYSDLFIVVQGRLVVAELKAKDGSASKHQIDFIEKIMTFGGIGGVCKSLAELEDLCDAARDY